MIVKVINPIILLEQLVCFTGVEHQIDIDTERESEWDQVTVGSWITAQFWYIIATASVYPLVIVVIMIWFCLKFNHLNSLTVATVVDHTCRGKSSNLTRHHHYFVFRWFCFFFFLNSFSICDNLINTRENNLKNNRQKSVNGNRGLSWYSITETKPMFVHLKSSKWHVTIPY